MATVTKLVTYSNTAASPSTTGSFTPTANDLLVVITAGTGTSTEPNPTITSTGFVPSWTRINSALFQLTTAGNNGRGAAWVANSLATATLSTVTVDWPLDGTTGNTVYVCGIAGMAKTGAAAIRQYAQDDSHAAGTPMAAALASAALTGNPLIAFVTDEGTSATQTAPSGWTELDEQFYTVPTVRTQISGRNSGFTGTAVTWGVSSTGVYGAIAIEFDASPALLLRPAMAPQREDPYRYREVRS